MICRHRNQKQKQIIVLSAEHFKPTGKRSGQRPILKKRNLEKIQGLTAWFLRMLRFGLFLYTRASTRTRGRVYAGAVLMLTLLTASFVPGALAESSSSSSYRIDYSRFTSDSDRKTSSSYVLLDSISDIQVEGSSSTYNMRNVYSGISVAPPVGPVCGNGIIETGEQCELPNDFQGLTCNDFGFLEGTLQCVNCQILTTSCFNPPDGGGGPLCGNGIRDANEQCDDGNLFAGDGCNQYCFIEAYECGNGIKEIGEQCDDGNLSNNDGCTAICTLEIPTEIPEPEPEPPFIFEPGFDPSLIYPGLGPEPELPPIRPAAPEEVVPPIRPAAPGYYDYHYEMYQVGEGVSILDETPFIVTAAKPDAVYEVLIVDENNSIIVRQGAKATKEGVLMFESLPFLEYKTYVVLLIDSNREAYKAWTISIEDRIYQNHENLTINGIENREYIALGTFEEIEVMAGSGKANTEYYAYLQKMEQQGEEISPITYLRTKADENGKYEFSLPEKLDDGTYILNVVQVYEDRKVSENKRYIFDIGNEKRGPPIWILIAIVLASLFGRWKELRIRFEKRFRKIKKIRKVKMHGGAAWKISALSVLLVLNMAFPASAVVTTPSVFVYEGKLLDSTNTPITSSQTFRLSLWSSDDLLGTDLLGSGAIDITAPAYSGWAESHTITPNTDGTFFLELGSIVPLPDMDFSIHKHLMVEVKSAGSPDTSYELMDPTGDAGADGNDRQTIGSTPYTNNADFIDNAELGTSAGDIATLSTGGVWDVSLIPDGTNTDSWTIDKNDSVVAGDIVLQFGDTLAETLLFDITNDWFEFSNDVNLNQNELKNFAIDNLAAAPAGPVTGQIYHNTTDGNTYIWNGVAWEDITEVADDDLDTVYQNDTDKEMDVLDVRGITFNIDTTGDFLVDLQDTGDFRIADDGTDFAIFTDDGLFGIGTTSPSTVIHADSNDLNSVPILTLENTAGDLQFFRTDATPEAAITGSIGDLAIDSTNGNAYIKNSGTATNTGWVQFGGQEGKQVVFQVEYPNATVEGDGTNNKGLLQSYFVDDGGSDKYNYLEWTTLSTSIQDIDVIITYILPPDFVSFTSTPLSVLYRTSDGVTTTNRLDVALYDTTGTAVTLGGGSALASATWATENITFGGGPTFTAGDAITLVIKLSATSAGYARVSDVIFNYNGT